MSAPARSRNRRVRCACCGRPGYGRGRGLVAACWIRAERAGTLDRWPVLPKPARRPRSRLVQDALALRARYGRPETRTGGPWGNAAPSDCGITWERVAAELGVTSRCLEKARERAGWPDVP